MIVVSHGKDIVKSTLDALIASDIFNYLDKKYSVCIKPNLVNTSPASNGATTHKEVVEGIILFLKEYGINKIKIIESSWIGASTKRAFINCGYDEFIEKYEVPLIDLKSDSSISISFQNQDFKICSEALSTDFLINVPVLKAHCQTRLTCCMKNLKGCIPDSEKRKYHTMGLSKPIAILNKLLPVGYNVIDGICGDLSFEEGGNPIEANRIIAGRDSFLLDSYCAKLIGYRPEEIGYLEYGRTIGLGEYFSSQDSVKEINSEEKLSSFTRSSRAAERYIGVIDENSACSACYSSLIYALHRLGSKGKALEKIHIGQGFKEKQGDGIGIGNCACGFTKNIIGCPPKASDILEMLIEISG